MADRFSHGRIPVRRETLQRFTDIDLDESRTWEEVKRHFSSFKPTVESSDDSGDPGTLTMAYAAGPPEGSRLRVSDGGQLAIHADSSSQHTVFFADAGVITRSNANLEKVGSGFRLAPTGVSVAVHNHPAQGGHTRLPRVEAVPANADKDWAKDLETRCDIFHKNITGMKTEWDEVWSTPEKGEHKASPDPGAQRKIDARLTELQAGDAFLIKAKQQTNLRNAGWNEHYAGVVAVDGADSITLENYNRDPEATDLLDEVLVARTGQTLFELNFAAANTLSSLKKERDKKWFFQSKTEINQRIAEAQEAIRRLSDLAGRIGQRTVATHYFRMYGPAGKGQSFLDQWKDKMQGAEGSALKVHQQERDG